MFSLLFLLLALALAAACSGDGPDDSSSQTGGDAPLPGLPAGERLVYLRGYGPPVELVVYDLAAGQPLWTKQLPHRDDGPPPLVSLLGDQVLVADEKGVSLLSANGSSSRQLLSLQADWERVADVAGSPDGKLVAVSIRREPEIIGPSDAKGPIPTRPSPHSVVILDVATRRVVRSWDSTLPELAGFAGSFSWLNWRSDSSAVLVSGDTSSERPGGRATLFLDGRALNHELQGFADVVPGAQLVAHGMDGILGCLTIAGHRLAIRDLDSGRDVVVIEDPARAFTGWEWSPDASEYLVRSKAYDPVAATAPDCGKWWNSGSEWLSLDVSTGKTTPVSDVQAVYQRWHGARYIEFKGCDNESSLEFSHWQTRSGVCTRNRTVVPGELMVGGKVIDHPTAVEIIGFID